MLIARKVDTTRTVNGRTTYQNVLAEKTLSTDLIASLLPAEKILHVENRMAQWHLKQALKDFGYSFKSSGVCHGLANMAMQAVILDERDDDGKLVNLERFDRRYQLIENVSSEKLQSLVTEIRKKCSAMKGDDHLSEKEKMYLEIPAFLDGVLLYQTGSSFPYLFEKYKCPNNQEEQPVAQIVMSKKIRQNGGIVSAERVSGIYKQDEIIEYFKSLRASFQKIKTFTHPVALVISNYNHTIMVGYDPRLDEWILVDANRLPSKKINNTAALVNEISKAFSSEGKTIAFGAEIFVCARYSEELRESKILEEWKARDEWKKMHEVTNEKIILKDTVKGNWRKNAKELGQADVVKKIDKLSAFSIDYYLDLISGVYSDVVHVEKLKKMPMHNETLVREFEKQRKAGIVETKTAEPQVVLKGSNVCEVFKSFEDDNERKALLRKQKLNNLIAIVKALMSVQGRSYWQAHVLAIVKEIAKEKDGDLDFDETPRQPISRQPRSYLLNNIYPYGIFANRNPGDTVRGWRREMAPVEESSDAGNARYPMSWFY